MRAIRAGRSSRAGRPTTAAATSSTAPRVSATFNLGGTGLTSCYYDESSDECQGCGPDNESSGDCTNTCAVNVCADDPSRTIFTGGPADNEGCHQFDDDQQSCERAFHRGESGVTSCFFTPADGGGLVELPRLRAGKCGRLVHQHLRPAAELQRRSVSRTIFAGGPGTAACRQFDDDAVSCGSAFHRSQFDIDASCFVAFDCQPCGVGAANATGAGAGISGPTQPIECVNECVPPPPCLDGTLTMSSAASETEACGRFNGNQTACEMSYHLGNAGVASCWYDGSSDLCRGCGPSNESEGSCTNTCVPPPSCSLDLNRMIFAGGPDTEACRQFDGNQTDCEKAFHRTGAGYIASCFYDAGNDRCFGCGPRREGELDCTNTCAPPPSCDANPSRTIFAGGPDTEACGQFDGNQTDCEKAFHRSLLLPDGSFLISSCYYDNGSCRGCGPNNETNGNCTNDCTPIPTCDMDSSRTLFAGRFGSHACQKFNGDQTSCEKAYHEGDGGVASCWFDASSGNCLGCGPSNANDGLCTNTCQPPPFCTTDPARTSFGTCQQFDGDPRAAARRSSSTPSAVLSPALPCSAAAAVGRRTRPTEAA